MIPTPPRGYWQKLAAGHDVARAALPPSDDSTALKPSFIRYAPGEEPKKEADPPAREVPPYEAFEKMPKNRITVGKRLTNPHPMTAHAKAAYKQEYLDPKYGWSIPSQRPTINIKVTPQWMPRALLIIDALLKALDARGIRVTNEARGHRLRTYAHLGDTRIPFDLYESSQKRERYDKGYERLTPYWVPSGLFVLRVCSEHFGPRAEWRDQKGRRRVEDCLNAFVVGLHREVERLEAFKRDREREHAAWDEANRRRQELRRQEEAEAAQAIELEALAQRWKLAGDIRVFLAAVEETHTAGGAIQPGSDISQWIAWGRSHADRLDPLIATPKE
jgi:hypothetical protein